MESIPRIKPTDDERAKILLGEALFHDVRLSKDNSISCASCHDVKTGYGDAGDMAHSLPGVNGEHIAINVQTILNVAYNGSFFWDGRAATLEDQIDGPVHRAEEMGSNWPEILTKLKDDGIYKAQFHKIYGAPMSEASIKDAIASYERFMVTPNAPFDRYLDGDKTAISEQAQEGYALFVKYGCVSCHQGKNIGGNIYQRLGVVKPYYKEDTISEVNYGRYNVTKNDRDKYVFRVPSLRNVAQTPPYMHDGSAKTLSDAVKVMALHQLGRRLSDEEINSIVAFLETLTGEVQGVAKETLSSK